MDGQSRALPASAGPLAARAAAEPSACAALSCQVWAGSSTSSVLSTWSYLQLKQQTRACILPFLFQQWLGLSTHRFYTPKLLWVPLKGSIFHGWGLGYCSNIILDRRAPNTGRQELTTGWALPRPPADCCTSADRQPPVTPDCGGDLPGPQTTRQALSALCLPGPTRSGAHRVLPDRRRAAHPSDAPTASHSRMLLNLPLSPWASVSAASGVEEPERRESSSSLRAEEAQVCSETPPDSGHVAGSVG